MNKELIYLATPYSHKDPEVQKQRFRRVNTVAAKLMGEGKHVFSPISHCHPIAEAGNLPKNWDFWEKYDIIMLNACTRVIVVCQEGWEDSTGVNAEIAIAEKMGLPIEYMKVQE